MGHLADKVCSCLHCQMLDIMFGDPLLNNWEKKFIDSLIQWGWKFNYTPRQKTTIRHLFAKMKAKYKRT